MNNKVYSTSSISPEKMKIFLYRYRFENEDLPANCSPREIVECFEDFDVSNDNFHRLESNKENLLKQFHNQIKSLDQKLDEKTDTINKNIAVSATEIIRNSQEIKEELTTLSNTNIERVFVQINDLKEKLSQKTSKSFFSTSSISLFCHSA